MHQSTEQQLDDLSQDFYCDLMLVEVLALRGKTGFKQTLALCLVTSVISEAA